MALKNTVLDAIIERWNEAAKMPEVMDGSESARESNARYLGRLEGIKLCADQLAEIMRLLASEDATYLDDIDRNRAAVAR